MLSKYCGPVTQVGNYSATILAKQIDLATDIVARGLIGGRSGAKTTVGMDQYSVDWTLAD
tara:strand:- start:364 stop:543 length:180 start_codon:yes stop_codon:yes gene_type:complete